MTHTLHPEIVDDIVNSMNHYVDKHMYHALGMKKVLEKHLGPYLNMPQPKDNEPRYDKYITAKNLVIYRLVCFLVVCMWTISYIPNDIMDGAYDKLPIYVVPTWKASLWIMYMLVIFRAIKQKDDQ